MPAGWRGALALVFDAVRCLRFANSASAYSARLFGLRRVGDLASIATDSSRITARCAIGDLIGECVRSLFADYKIGPGCARVVRL